MKSTNYLQAFLLIKHHLINTPFSKLPYSQALANIVTSPIFIFPLLQGDDGSHLFLS